MLKALKDRGTPVLFVDSGDTLYPRAFPADDSPDRRFRRAHFLVEALGRMHLDAWAPSPLDLLYPPNALGEQASGAGIALLASNLVWQGEPPPAFSRHLVKTVGSIRVGLFGLVRPFPVAPSSVRVADPIEAARREVEFLASRSDLVFGLSNLGIVGDEGVALAVPGIAAIFGAGDDRMLLIPRKIGDTLLFQPHRRGEYLGLLEIGKGEPMLPLRTQADAKPGSPPANCRAWLRPVSDDDPEDADIAAAVKKEIAAE